MAYVDQTKKAKIAAAVKAAVPADWKYSLRVDNHSTIVMTVAAAKKNLLEAFASSEYFNPKTATHTSVNPYHYRNHIVDGEVADVVGKVIEALNTDNFDHSDIHTDYFYVGHYVSLQIGRWNKPFEVRK